MTDKQSRIPTMKDHFKDTDNLSTIRDFIRWTISRFNEAEITCGHGTDNTFDEAFGLILPLLHLPHDIPPALFDSHLTEAERDILRKAIERRVTERTPSAYITRQMRFGNLFFYVDERVLIPRSPIGELIENQFAPWIKEDKVHQILDLCTGSGCIAIACAAAFPTATIDASDISEDALAVAALNVTKHAMQDTVALLQSDLFDQLPKKKYDIIVSNPPYVGANDMASLPAEYRHEPSLALAAGVDGLDIVKRILADAASYLSPHGILVVEVGNSETALMEQYPDLPFTWVEFENGDGGVFLLQASEL